MISESALLWLSVVLLLTSLSVLGVCAFMAYLVWRTYKHLDKHLAHSTSLPPLEWAAQAQDEAPNAAPAPQTRALALREEDGGGGDEAFCVLHNKRHARGLCRICEEAFCESCLRESDGISLCFSHFKLFLAETWVEIREVKTTPETPENSLGIHQFKRRQWREHKIPALITTQYKINFDDDGIETYVKLLVREQDAETLRHQLEGDGDTGGTQSNEREPRSAQPQKTALHRGRGLSSPGPRPN